MDNLNYDGGGYYTPKDKKIINEICNTEILPDEEKYNLMISLIQEMSGTYSKAGNSVCFILKEEYDFE